MMLAECEVGMTVTISDLTVHDDEFKSFLFTLGCYAGEEITIVSKKKHNMVVALKDGRYNIDNDIAKAILVK